MKKGIDRRQFVGGAGILAAAGMVGMLAGCSQPQANGTGGDKAVDTQPAPQNISETHDCDILVIGSGAGKRARGKHDLHRKPIHTRRQHERR